MKRCSQNQVELPVHGMNSVMRDHLWLVVAARTVESFHLFDLLGCSMSRMFGYAIHVQFGK